MKRFVLAVGLVICGALPVYAADALWCIGAEPPGLQRYCFEEREQCRARIALSLGACEKESTTPDGPEACRLQHAALHCWKPVASNPWLNALGGIGVGMSNAQQQRQRQPALTCTTRCPGNSCVTTCR